MQTVIDSTDLRSIQTELGALGDRIASIASIEADLLKEKAERLSLSRKAFQRREEENEETLNARLHLIAETNQNSLNEAAAWLEGRNARIQRAYHASKNRLAEQVQGVKDRRIGLVQGAIMRNRQARQSELDQSKGELDEFFSRMTELGRERKALRKQAISGIRSYRLLLANAFKGSKTNSVSENLSAEECREELIQRMDEVKREVVELSNMPFAMMFRYVPLWVLVVVIVVLHFWLGSGDGMAAISTLVILLVVVMLLWGVGFATIWKPANQVARGLLELKELEKEAAARALFRHQLLETEVSEEHEADGQSLSETFSESDSEWKSALSAGQKRLDERMGKIPTLLDLLYQRKLDSIESTRQMELEQAREEAAKRSADSKAAKERDDDDVAADILNQIGAQVDSWESGVRASILSFQHVEETNVAAFPKWTSETASDWSAPDVAPSEIRIGELQVDLPNLAGKLPQDERLALEAPSQMQVPFALALPHQGSLMIESDGDGAAAATAALNAATLRILASHPVGRSSFVFIDPVGLGKDFAGLMHLADYEDSLITSRIWTQSTQIEERLAELNEHIEKVIQMYLRNEYADIAEYNEQAGTIAEKSRFLVIAGFPTAFSETACKRLLSIASSGARCGVHLLIQRDLRQPIPDGALEDELRRACIRVRSRADGFELMDARAGANLVKFDSAPTDEDFSHLIHRIGKASVDSNRVQVPFSHIAPGEGEMWSLSATEELRVPIGRTGAKKLQMLSIGKGTKQHMLVAGKTGSGKSTLFHVIITNLALWCSPEEVEFYLVDFKKGVEFKCYAARKLPHARVVAIESDREFALSVLQKLDDELKRRGEIFRQAGAQDLPGYKRTPGHEPMPRSLLLIDEFQEFFTEDDSVSQETSLLLDRIVRQGRAFGIHVILGSQTLGGAYTLARATLGQMVIRVALQCNEADAHLIMEDDNPAPRMLTRPGEGIYNDQAGAIAANSPFQIVWLPEEERDELLHQVAAMAGKQDGVPPQPVIFEGNAPADVRDNAELQYLRSVAPVFRPSKARIWLGAPNSIKGDTEAIFQRQSGSHLLMVGQSASRSLSMLAISVAALAAQYPPDQAEFVILDPHAHENGGGAFQKLMSGLPHRIYIGGLTEVGTLLSELSMELENRAESAGRDAPEIFLIIQDLQRFKALRPDDDFRFSLDDDASGGSPAQILSALLGEGAPAGIHVLASIDSWNNVSRWIPRKLLAEFEMRVLFQMSANDSSNLMDAPTATNLGMHRALLYNEHMGTVETFRPYSMPDEQWLGSCVMEQVR